MRGPAATRSASAVTRLVANAPRLVAVAVGVWLVVAPSVLDHGGRAEASDRTVGPVVAALSFVALWELGRGLRLVTLPLGVWLVLAPLVLWYGDLVAGVNSALCGLLIILTAPMDRWGTDGFGGGWAAVLRSATGRSGKAGQAEL
jgi:hypothetical protein